jgi:hypothetical protein
MLSLDTRITTAGGRRDMDSFLDRLHEVFQRLEGRLIPRGWSAALVLGLMLGAAGVLVALAFLLV